VVDKDKEKPMLSNMKKNALGKESAVIGEITKENKGKVVLETVIGGERIIDRLTGDQLPRIC
jgi:hydrogenase expression/formation protein HypE